jgi:hypothetical protein
LEFRVTGAACGALGDCEDTALITGEEIYIVAEGRNGPAFEGIVPIGGYVQISSGLERDLEVTIYSPANGAAGSVLQELGKIELDCEGDEGGLTLLQEFGALQLTGFTNPDQGSQSVLDDVTITYFVRNAGVLGATATSASATGGFDSSTLTLISSATELGPGEQLSFPQETVRLNLLDEGGNEFRFEASVTGAGTVSGITCDDSEAFIFRVES